MSKSLYKKVYSVGPGGTKCSCCFPPGGSKFRKAAKRALGKSVRKFLSGLIAE